MSFEQLYPPITEQTRRANAVFLDICTAKDAETEERLKSELAEIEEK